jgi:hypothetical protein
MPTKATEYSLLKPGSLVRTKSKVYIYPDDTEENYDKKSLNEGIVGIILQTPTKDRPRQYLIEFVGGDTWWMYTNEFEPYIMAEDNPSKGKK